MHCGRCRLCLLHRDLCDSHALPNSLFNYILRNSAGKAIVLSGNPSAARYSSDTWDVELLCADSERKLNVAYDRYGMAVFRGHEGSVVRAPGGIRFLGIDRRRLRMFFLSVLWRMSVSSHSSYSNVSLLNEWNEELRQALHAGTNLPSARFAVAVRKLRDSTPEHGFSNEALRTFIMSPFTRSVGSLLSVCFPFLGFFVEVLMPPVPRVVKKHSEILCGSHPVFLARYVEFFGIPEFVDFLGSVLLKERSGASEVR